MLRALLTLIIIAALAAVVMQLLPKPEAMTGRAGIVSDGDTFWLLEDNKRIHVRLCGINAPDEGEPGYDAARQALKAILLGHQVSCLAVGDGSVCDGRSKHLNNGRLVAQCHVRQHDVAAELVRLGHACDWPRFSGGHYGIIDGACRK